MREKGLRQSLGVNTLSSCRDVGSSYVQVIADGTKSPLPVDPRTIKAGEEVVGEEDDYR
jgi:hypothetical protein